MKRFLQIISSLLIIAVLSFVFHRVLPNFQFIHFASAALAVDVKSDSSDKNNADPWSWSHNNSGNLLVVGIQTTCVNSLSSVTFNGTSLTLADSQISGSNNKAYIYYLANPDVGNYTISVDFSGGCSGTGGGISFTNADTANPIDDTTVGTGSAKSSDLTMSTSVSGDYIVDAINVSSIWPNSYACDDGTIIAIAAILTNGEGGECYESVAGAGSYSRKWTWNGSFNSDYSHVAVAIKPSGASNSCTAPSSGNWYIQSSDNCYVTANTFVNGDCVILNNTGPGSFNIIDGATLACKNIMSTSTPVYVESGSFIKLWNPT